MDPDKLSKSIVDEQSDTFEQMVLTALIYNSKLFLSVRDMLCVDPVTKKWTNEFTNPMDNALYKMLVQYNAAFGSSKAPVLSLTFARTILEMLARRGDGVSSIDEVDEIIDRLVPIMQTNPIPIIPIVNNGFVYWLRKARYTRMVGESTQHADWDPEKVISFTQMQVEAVKFNDAESFLHAFGSGVHAKLLDIKRLPSGLAPLDSALNGGFGYQEAVLFVAPQGSGKTVLACQLAHAWAAANKRGLLFTTEQPHEQLEPRIIANACRIPFNIIADKVDLRKLNPKQQEDYHNLEEIMKKNLFIYDWCKDRSLSVLGNFEDILKRAQDKIGTLDWFVFDWIGGGLGEMAVDPAQVRLIYQRTGDKIADLCLKYNLAGAAFAQADMTKGVNNPRVGASCIAECKTVGRSMSVGVGITAMFEKNEAQEGQKPAFSKKQSFYVFKSRKGEDRHVPVMRQFDQQRFTSGF